MKRLIILLCFLFINLSIISQTIHTYDEIIDMHYYKAYYSKTIKTSSFVIYKLYKGGGNASRASYSFKSYKNLPHFEYSRSGYDKGHLVPAEDLAVSNLKLKSTFYYINCVPQKPNLNRGVWKQYESKIRKRSQVDSLLIICGGCDYPRNNCIPKNCFKIVYDLRTKKCIYSTLYTNTSHATAKENDKLKQTITFKKAIHLYNKNGGKNSSILYFIIKKTLLYLYYSYIIIFFYLKSFSNSL